MLSSGALRAKRNNPGYYSIVEEQEVIDDVSDDNDSIDYQSYQKRPLLQSYEEMPDIYIRQIWMDLDRTFSETPNFIMKNDLNRLKLYNILTSYAKRNSSIGYWQGMNYIAATLLRVLGDEEDTFWAFCNLIESILPLDYYSQMVEVIVDQNVFVHLLQQRKPRLFTHLQSMGLDVAMILFQWFIWIFSSQLKQAATETIWDFLLIEGTVTIFRAAFAILSILEEEIMDCTEFADIYTVLNSQPWETIDSPYTIITHMKKYLDIDEALVHRLRNEFRPDIAKEQRKIWQVNARSKCPSEYESYYNKRVKLLYKFPLLERYIRTDDTKQEENLGEKYINLSSCKRLNCSGSY